jgi:hypothetical protein
MQYEKKNLKRLINEELFLKHEDLSPQRISRITNDIFDVVQEFNNEVRQDFTESHYKITLDYEQNRKMFGDYINILKDGTETLLKIYKDKKFVEIKLDTKKGKNVMTPKTEVLKQTCEFLNMLNDLVVKYNIEVMKKNIADTPPNQMYLF